MIVMAAGLSFWGLGAQPPQAEWGVMLSEFAKTGTAFLGALRLFLSITVLFS